MISMVDLREHDGRYYFRISSGDGFWDTVELLKNTFSPRECDFDDDARVWSAPANELNEAKLALIFSTFPSLFEYGCAQPPLF